MEFISDDSIFWVEKLEPIDIKDFISMFRNEFKPPQTLWIEKVNYNNLETNTFTQEFRSFYTFQENEGERNIDGLDISEEIQNNAIMNASIPNTININ